MWSQKRQTGNLGEDVACQFLKSKGFTVVERNVNKPWGEIDIVAEKNDNIRFIEVKAVTRENADSKASRETGILAEEMAHSNKLRKVARAAALYMESKGDNRDFQIDVVAVYLDKQKRKAHCTLYEQVL